MGFGQQQGGAPTGGLSKGAGIASSLTTIVDFVGNIIGIFGQRKADNARKASYEYNAAIMNQRAQMVQQAAQVDINRQRRKARRYLGAQRAAYAKAGVRLSGSPLEVMVTDQAELILDQEITRYNAASQAWSLRADAAQQLQMGQAVESASFIKAGTSLLSTTIPRMKDLGFGQRKPQDTGGGVGSTIATTYGGQTVFGTRGT